MGEFIVNLWWESIRLPIDFDSDAKWSIVRIVQKGLQVNGQRDNSGFVVHAELCVIAAFAVRK